MKKLLVLLFVLFLTGCSGGVELIEVPRTITEYIEVEVEKIVEVEVEVPGETVYINNEECDIPEPVEVEVLVDSESKTLFLNTDANQGILVLSVGDTSYIIEYKYAASLLSTSMLKLVRIEKQISSEVDEAFLYESYTGEDLTIQHAAINWEEAVKKMEIMAAEVTFESVEELYTKIKTNYYDNVSQGG